jgi:hypothetical protein
LTKNALWLILSLQIIEQECKMASTIQIRIDEDTKAQASSLLADMGMDISTAVKMFLKEIINERKLPFQPKAKAVGMIPLKPGITPATSRDTSWLDHPIHVEPGTKPLTREEMYDRL